MSALLLRDAVRRFGAGLALALLPFAWVWRAWPPWEVRVWLWSLEGVAALGAALGLPLVWAILTAPVIRLQLRSARLEYWRQFPISRVQWLRLHAVHLACIDAPGIGVAVYLFAPLHDRWLVAGATTGALVLALAAQVGLALAPIPRVLASPHVRTVVGALWRLNVLAVLRRDRSAAWLALAIQLAAVAYAVIGVANVVDDEPAAAWSLLHGAAIFAGFTAAWLVLRAQRAVDRDRWYLDAFPAVRPAVELAARVLTGVSLLAPTIVGLAIAAAPVGLLRAALFAVLVGVWASAAFTRIGARAEARARLQDPQHTAAVLVLAYGVAALLVLGPLALVPAAVLELALARRALARAAEVRARFETSNHEDDHE